MRKYKKNYPSDVFEYQIWKCASCGHAATIVEGDQEYWYEKFLPITETSESLAKNKWNDLRTRDLLAKEGRILKVLDLGGGKGEFLLALKNDERFSDVELVGVDFDARRFHLEGGDDKA